MQIVNPLRAALPYITLQTAKVQHCWADYFIFRGFAGAAGRFGSAETSGLRPLKPPSGRFGLRPALPLCSFPAGCMPPPPGPVSLCIFSKNNPLPAATFRSRPLLLVQLHQKNAL